MNEPFQHPLDNIYHNNSLLLLEAMIPYVEPSLKLPLALLIKMQEIKLLMQVLTNPSRMEACGLNRSNSNSEEMLSMLCNAMGFDFMEQMKNMQNVMNVMNTMNAMNDTGALNITNVMNNMQNPQKSPERETPDSDFSSETRNDMIDAIRQILSEQEGESYEP